MPPKKAIKFKVTKPAPKKMTAKADAQPKKTIKFTRKPKKDEYDFDKIYTRLNTFINDTIDLKSIKTNRKVGIRSVRSKLQSFLNKQKKENKKVSDSEIKKFLNQQYPDSDYYYSDF